MTSYLLLALGISLLLVIDLPGLAFGGRRRFAPRSGANAWAVVRLVRRLRRLSR